MLPHRYAAFREVPATVTIVGCTALFVILVAHGVIEMRMEMASVGAEDGKERASTVPSSPRGGVILSERSRMRAEKGAMV